MGPDTLINIWGRIRLSQNSIRPLRSVVERLHLQTPALDGGLYARLGWEPIAQVTNHGLDALVMERVLSG